jgi:hypothetical protein
MNFGKTFKYENPFCGLELLHINGWTERQTGKVKVTGAF